MTEAKFTLVYVRKLLASRTVDIWNTKRNTQTHFELLFALVMCYTLRQYMIYNSHFHFIANPFINLEKKNLSLLVRTLNDSLSPITHEYIFLFDARSRACYSIQSYGKRLICNVFLPHGKEESKSLKKENEINLGETKYGEHWHVSRHSMNTIFFFFNISVRKRRNVYSILSFIECR